MEVPFPKSVLNLTLTPSQGKYTFDPVGKILTWDVGRMDPTKLPSIKGNVSLMTALGNESIIAVCYVCKRV